jgi:hypothetical protein
MTTWKLLFFLAAASPEQRAVTYLTKEVPAWSRDNHCFSCHNNGDAARALFAARRHGYSVPDDAVRDTVEWLKRPADWDNNHGNPGFSDTKLARIQFAAALADARLEDRGPLFAAAESLLPLQESKGAWRIDTGGMPGAPATYGAVLATYMARETLAATGAVRFVPAIDRANAWLRSVQPSTVPDTAVLLLALPERKELIPPLRAAQNADGGWGPLPHAPAEAFDTALAILALRNSGETALIDRGRKFLISVQQAGGGWPETTRPAGQVSYAEHISTSGWALYALLLTDPKSQ